MKAFAIHQIAFKKISYCKEHQDDFGFCNNSRLSTDFKKYKTSVLFEGYITDNFGLIFNYNQTYSEITQQKYHKEYVDQASWRKRKLKEKMKNFFLKGVLVANDNLTIRPSIILCTLRNNTIWVEKTQKAEVEGGGLTTAIEFDYDFGRNS